MHFHTIFTKATLKYVELCMVGICLFVRMTLQEMLISKSEKMILEELLGKRVLCFILNPRI
jgi:hypothetical protein